MLLAVLLAQPAPAPDWWLVGGASETTSRHVFVLDAASIRRTGDVVEVEEGREADRPDERGIIGARLRVRYDCRARTAQVLIYRFVRSDGSVRTDTRGQERPEPVPDESIATDYLRTACGEQPPIERLGAVEPRSRANALFGNWPGAGTD